MASESDEVGVVDGGATAALEDRWVPVAGGIAARIRTLVYDKGHGGREAWMERSLAPALGEEFGPARVYLGQQCHGTTVWDVDQEGHEALDLPGRREFPLCDGLVTRQLEVALAVRTADCVPIIAVDTARRWIGGVHAGWRGTFGGILQELLRGAVADGSDPANLRLWVGPHIHACHYEISEQLSREFEEQFRERRVLRGSRHLSLLDVNIAQALRVGVPEANIESSPLCTFEERHGLPSYRRDGRCRGEIVTTVALMTAR